jgi:ABC-2 type transport system ATP-binding protein
MNDAENAVEINDESASAEPKNEAKAMIESVGLSKYYGNFVATSEVSFSVAKGEVTAFLGPNGAGKSTTMKMLTGYLAPSAGKALIGGHNVAENQAARSLIGYLPENGPLYAEMTPMGLLKFLGRARGLSGSVLRSRIDYVEEQCSLSSVLRKPIAKLSKGFRQRIGMAQALLHDPEVLILDEPTSGLDPNQVHGVRELITSLAESKTILLSTHILREVKAICQRVIVIHQGKIVFDGNVDEMAGTEAEMEERFRELTTV